MAHSGNGAVYAMKEGGNPAAEFPGTYAGIQAALDFVKSPSVTGVGGKVIVGPGTYLITAPLSIGPNSILRGMGRYNTVIKADPSFAGAAMITNSEQTGNMQWCALEDISIEGNSDGGATVALGVYFKGIGQPSRVRDVTINKCSGIGLKLEGISTNAGSFTVLNTGVSNCPSGGIVLTGYTAGYTLRDIDVEFVDAGVAAIYIDGSTASFYPACVTLDCVHIEGLQSGSIGILIESARNVHVKDVMYFGSGSVGDLVKITGTATEIQNVILENLTAAASSVANAIVDSTNNTTIANTSDGVNITRYDCGSRTQHQGRVIWKRASDQASASSVTPGNGNIIHLTGGTTLGTLVTDTTETGRVLVVWFAATTIVNDGSAGGGNIFIANSKPFTFRADDTLTLFSNGTNWIEIARSVNVWGPGAAIASAATIAIPAEGSTFHVTGTTNITNGITVDASRDAGRIVVLIFDGILTISDTGTSKLTANFTTSPDDTLTLACDGTNWFELARGVN